jgi:hypothetical protein
VPTALLPFFRGFLNNQTEALGVFAQGLRNFPHE